VVAGFHNKYYEDIKAFAAFRENVRVIEKLPSLAFILSDVDLTIGAGGSSTWERACLGVPSIVIPISENQEVINEYLEKEGYIQKKDKSKIGCGKLAADVKALLSKERLLKDSYALTDGRGASRVALVIARHLSQSQLIEQISIDSRDKDKIVVTVSNSNIKVCRLNICVAGDLAEFDLQSEEAFCNESYKTIIRLIYSDSFKARLSAYLPEEAFLKLIVNDNAGLKESANVVKGLRVTLLTDSSSWINSYLSGFIDRLWEQDCYVSVVNKAMDIRYGDVCFLLGCEEIVAEVVRKRNKYNLVVHESDLPKGRGWSPMTWHIIDQKNVIPVSLIEAEAEVDAGDVYMKTVIRLSGTELVDEWREQQAAASILLCNDWIKAYKCGNSLPSMSQEGQPSFYPRRRPADSELDTRSTLGELIPLLRVVDNVKYPAFFKYKGVKYVLRVYREEREDEIL
jgi:hypothetical protein